MVIKNVLYLFHFIFYFFIASPLLWLCLFTNDLWQARAEGWGWWFPRTGHYQEPGEEVLTIYQLSHLHLEQQGVYFVELHLLCVVSNYHFITDFGQVCHSPAEQFTFHRQHSSELLGTLLWVWLVLYKNTPYFFVKQGRFCRLVLRVEVNLQVVQIIIIFVFLARLFEEQRAIAIPPAWAWKC